MRERQVQWLISAASCKYLDDCRYLMSCKYLEIWILDFLEKPRITSLLQRCAADHYYVNLQFALQSFLVGYPSECAFERHNIRGLHVYRRFSDAVASR